jgi:hypothetical protein
VLLETNHPSKHTSVGPGTVAVQPKAYEVNSIVSSGHTGKIFQVYSQHEALPQAYIQFCNEYSYSINMSLKLSLNLEHNMVFQAEVYASNASEAENTEWGYSNRNETSILCQKVWL